MKAGIVGLSRLSGRRLFLLAAGLALTTATQLRLSGVPIGPGEILCLIWLSTRIPSLARNRANLWGDATIRGFVLFWGGLLLAMGVGTVSGLASPAWDVTRSTHDGLSFIFASLLSIAVLAYFRKHPGDVKGVFDFLLVFVLTMNFGLWLAAKFQFGAVSATFMYAPTRFQGLANNPNQLALLLVGMPFMAWYCMEVSVNIFGKVLGILAIGVAMFLGLQTGSDALKVAVLVGVALLVISSVKSISHRGVGWKWRVVALGVIFGVYVAGGNSDGLSQNIAADEGVRFALWRHAFEVWMGAPVFGMGPGAWSGIDAPFEGVEAHNSFLDIGVSAGVVGLIVYLSALFWIATRLLKNDCYILLITLVVILIYSLFHYVLRHPFFWGLIVLLVCLCARRTGRLGGGLRCLTGHSKTCAG